MGDKDNLSAISKNSKVTESPAPKRRTELLRSFKKYDKDGSGFIDAKELQELFRDLGIEKTEEEIVSMILNANSNSSVDVATNSSSSGNVVQSKLIAASSNMNLSFVDNGNSSTNDCTIDSDGRKSDISTQQLDFDHFERLFSLSRLLDVFNEMDTDKSGYLDRREVARVMKRLGHKVSANEVTAMIEAVDLDKSGNISFEEFKKAFGGIPLASFDNVAQHWAFRSVVTDLGGDMGPTSIASGLTWWQTVISGGTAGVLARTATAPLERVKIAAQTGRMFENGGMIAELKGIVANQGFRGLFAGNLMNCIRVFPSAGIFCSLYTKLLALTPADDVLDSMEPVYRLSCSAISALVSITATYPLDLIRSRLTVSMNYSKAEGQKLTIRQAWKDGMSGVDGIRGLYVGLTPTLLAVVPFIAIQNATIDLLQVYAIENGWEASPMLLLCVGGGAGVLAQTIVYPLDVLRRRMQVAIMESDISGGTVDGRAPNTSIVADRTWLSINKVVKERGLRTLFAGITPTFLKTIPAISICSIVTSVLNDFFREVNGSIARQRK